MADSTFFRVRGLTLIPPLTTRDAVPTPTPATRATSESVGCEPLFLIGSHRHSFAKLHFEPDRFTNLAFRQCNTRGMSNTAAECRPNPKPLRVATHLFVMFDSLLLTFLIWFPFGNVPNICRLLIGVVKQSLARSW